MSSSDEIKQQLVNHFASQGQTTKESEWKRTQKRKEGSDTVRRFTHPVIGEVEVRDDAGGARTMQVVPKTVALGAAAPAPAVSAPSPVPTPSVPACSSFTAPVTTPEQQQAAYWALGRSGLELAMGYTDAAAAKSGLMTHGHSEAAAAHIAFVVQPISGSGQGLQLGDHSGRVSFLLGMADEGQDSLPAGWLFGKAARACLKEEHGFEFMDPPGEEHDCYLQDTQGRTIFQCVAALLSLGFPYTAQVRFDDDLEVDCVMARVLTQAGARNPQPAAPAPRGPRM